MSLNVIPVETYLGGKSYRLYSTGETASDAERDYKNIRKSGREAFIREMPKGLFNPIWSPELRTWENYEKRGRTLQKHYAVYREV